MIDELAIRRRFETLRPVFDERSRRRFAAAEALTAGRGGIAAVARATGIAPSTIGRALREVRSGEALEPGRVRRPGAGASRCARRMRACSTIWSAGRADTRGDPESPLRWTCKSLRKLAGGAVRHGPSGQPHAGGRAAARAGLQPAGQPQDARRQQPSRSRRPVRTTSTTQVKAALAAGEPAISVDTKKKELVGDFKNGGREWQPKGEPEEVRVHDFVNPELGRRCPTASTTWRRTRAGSASASTTTRPAFAVATHPPLVDGDGPGSATPTRTRLLITADGGGSNGSRVRLWKWELQRLADETGLTDHRLPPPARHQQVEQDRASAVLVHHPELARQAAGQPRGHRQPDRRHDHRSRPDGRAANWTPTPTRPA